MFSYLGFLQMCAGVKWITKYAKSSSHFAVDWCVVKASSFTKVSKYSSDGQSTTIEENKFVKIWLINIFRKAI